MDIPATKDVLIDDLAWKEVKLEKLDIVFTLYIISWNSLLKLLFILKLPFIQAVTWQEN